ncbi:hypothetical protein RYX36_013550 [Vicia faba]
MLTTVNLTTKPWEKRSYDAKLHFCSRKLAIQRKSRPTSRRKLRRPYFDVSTNVQRDCRNSLLQRERRDLCGAFVEAEMNGTMKMTQLLELCYEMMIKLRRMMKIFEVLDSERKRIEERAEIESFLFFGDSFRD